MGNILIKYYKVTSPATIYNVDDYNKRVFPKKNNSGKHMVVKKGKFLKSLGLVERHRLESGSKPDFLILVNGEAVKLTDVELYQDDVDDCGCDGNPIAKPTDMEKLDGNMGENKFDETENGNKKEGYIGWKKFDKSQIICAILGAVVFGGIIWMVTKNKTKTIIGIIVGLIIGGVIGRFMGRSGEKKLEEDVDLNDTEQEIDTDGLQYESDTNVKVHSDEQQFLQIGQKYDFKLAQSLRPMAYSNGAFYVAKDKSGEKLIIKSNVKLNGKLVEITSPELFTLNPFSKTIEKNKINKPLPFIEIKKGLYVPLALIEPSSFVSSDEIISYAEGKTPLSDEIYVKGRYAGKRSYFALYMPSNEEAIKIRYGKLKQ